MKKTCLKIDLNAQFGMLKKTDFNNPMTFTFNVIHKPALLGVFGAILGLGGYAKKFNILEKQKKKSNKHQTDFTEPINVYAEYYEQLWHIPISIVTSERSITKFEIEYNNSIGFANAGSNLIVKEQTLYKPTYTIYALLDSKVPVENKLISMLLKHECEFIPYLGKNEFPIHWSAALVEHEEFVPNTPFRVDSYFTFSSEFVSIVKQEDSSNPFDISVDSISSDFFIHFERLPISLHPENGHYIFADFVTTNMLFQPKTHPKANLMKVKDSLANSEKIVHFF